MNLRSLQPIPTGKVQLRGGEVTVRAVSHRTLERVEVWDVPPVAPLGLDPAAGSLSPWIHRTDDPKYINDRRAWRHRINRVHAALALDVEVNGTRFDSAADDAKNALWAGAAGSEVGEVLTADEIARVLEAAAKLGEAIDKDAEKN